MEREGKLKGFQYVVDWLLGWVLKLRPAAYNRFTWFLLAIGAGMVASRIPFLSVLFLALWDRFVGDPAYLQSLLLFGGGNELYGLSIIFFALMFNLGCQYKEAVADRSVRIVPPELELEFYSLSDDPLGGTVKAQGWSVDASAIKDIPDYPLVDPEIERLQRELGYIAQFAGRDTLSKIASGVADNRDLYRQRLKFLNDFAGAVYFRCRLVNISAKSASEVKVRLNIVGKCNVDCSSDLSYSLPRKEEDTRLFDPAALVGRQDYQTGIEITEYSDGCRIEWGCSCINAKEDKECESGFWVMPIENLQVKAQIFAAELERPIVSDLFIEVAPAKEVALDDLTDDDLFKESVKAQEVAAWVANL